MSQSPAERIQLIAAAVQQVQPCVVLDDNVEMPDLYNDDGAEEVVVDL